MRILTLTTLYPNAAAPSHGIFVENRMQAFAERAQAEIRVIAPAPWFPIGARWAGRYGRFARTPFSEVRRGIEVRHPRYFIPPKVGMTYAVRSLERCFLASARALQAEGWDFDLIDAHYLYPDGVAAVRAARELGKPVIITARGTDVSLLPNYPQQREMILEAVRNADAAICVAKALKDELVRLGAPDEKISVLRNGVDLNLFRPQNRRNIRDELRLTGPVIASVGHLIERKGHHLVISAAEKIKGATLLIAGDGPLRGMLERQTRELGMKDRVRFLGAVPHERLAEIYSAADVLVLASSREGWPNVLLEAMACGTPVVATAVWGSSEVVTAPEAGTLCQTRSADALEEALRKTLDSPPLREATLKYAERHSWSETAAGMSAVFSSVIAADRTAKDIRLEPIKPSGFAPRLIVTIDTEESFDWNEFDAAQGDVCSVADISIFQKLASEVGVKPIYFLTAPVIRDQRSALYFKNLHTSQSADLGIHLHQWETPPLDGYRGEYFSWQCNLPPEIRLRKLQSLSALFERLTDCAPRAHRAGRYGASLASYAELAAIGIDMDFSPSPAFDFSARGGPDFSSCSNDPFSILIDDKRIAVTPVCGAKSVKGTRIFMRQSGAEAGFKKGSKGFRLTAPARLTSEGLSFADMRALTRRLLADKTPVITFSMHSTSLTPGGSPYARSSDDVKRMLDSVHRYFHYFQHDLGGEILTLDDLADLYSLSRKPALNLNRPLSASI